MRIAHSELVEHDFMTKLSDLPAHLQEFIRTADFNHYYCWRVVYKEDSQGYSENLPYTLLMFYLKIFMWMMLTLARKLRLDEIIKS